MPASPSTPSQPRKAAFLHGPELERYAYPPDCPFRTERAARTRQILLSTGLLAGPDRRQVAPPPASREELTAFHDARYLEVLQLAPRGHLDIEGLQMGLGTPETPIFAGLYEHAALACGASLAGARMLLDGQVQVAFNPSGGFHHARPARASGFCYLNDVVLACQHLAAQGRRVVFLDMDAHHGDGVQEAFYDRREVLTISFHESGQTLFPGSGWEDQTGAGPAVGYCANVPLPAGTYDEAFLGAFQAVALPLIGAFGPDVIVLELGLDGLSGDPLAHLELTNNAYAQVVEDVTSFGRPVLATGGGGYHVDNTARGWALLWSVMCGQEQAAQELSLGLGGVMLGSAEWTGGLRDRRLAGDPRRRGAIDSALAATIERVKQNVFPHHGL